MFPATLGKMDDCGAVAAPTGKQECDRRAAPDPDYTAFKPELALRPDRFAAFLDVGSSNRPANVAQPAFEHTEGRIFTLLAPRLELRLELRCKLSASARRGLANCICAMAAPSYQ